MERHISSKTTFDPHEAALVIRARKSKKSDDVFKISVKINNLEALRRLGEQMSLDLTMSSHESHVFRFGSIVQTGKREWIVTCQVTEDQYRMIVNQTYVLSIQMSQNIGLAFSNR